MGQRLLTRLPLFGVSILSVPNIVVSNNGTADFAPGVGLGHHYGQPGLPGTSGLFLVGGAAAVLVQQTGSLFVANTPAAGKVCLLWNGSTAYRIDNRQGNNITFNVASLRTRIVA